MTALEALKVLEDGARLDSSIAAALMMFRAGHPAAKSLTDYIDRPVQTDTPVPPTRPEGKTSRPR